MATIMYSVVTRDCSEPLVEGSLEVTANPGAVCLRDLIQAWPYEGQFHFRGQVATKAQKALMWLDLTDGDSKLPSVESTISIRAVPMFDLAEPAAEDEQVFDLSPAQWQQCLSTHQASLPDFAQIPRLDDASMDVCQAFPMSLSLPRVPSSRNASVSPAASQSQSANASSSADAAWGRFSSAANAAASFVKKHASTVDTAALSSSASAAVSGMSSFLKRAAGAAGALLEGGPAPSEAALVNLSDISTDLHTPFKPTHEAHEQLLQELWLGAFPALDFVRVTPQWQKLGFQNDDPATDFRGGGLLSLRCLVYFASHHGEELRRILRTQDRLRALVAGGASTSTGELDDFVDVGHRDLVAADEDASSVEHKLYPVAITSVNLTVRLAHMIHATDKNVASLHRRYWQLFDSYEGFYELHCMALLFFDQLWTQQQARFDGFGQLLDLLCKRVRGWLVEGQPTSVKTLRTAAAELDGLVM